MYATLLSFKFAAFSALGVRLPAVLDDAVSVPFATADHLFEGALFVINRD